MSKRLLFIIYLVSISFLSVTLFFQHHPGYMDAEYYYVGARAISEGNWSEYFLWNYLDQPHSLPHPLFTYWMPIPSILAAIPSFFGEKLTFFESRIVFVAVAAIIPVLTAWMAWKMFKSQYTSLVAAVLALFSGFYYKFMTIPETITPYILLGGLFFWLVQKYLTAKEINSKTYFLIYILGLISGLLNLTRVDGILFLFFGFAFIFIQLFSTRTLNKQKEKWKKFLQGLLFLLLGFITVMGPWYIRTLYVIGDLSVPVGLKPLWLQNYDDTFIFPASDLNFQYWLQQPFIEKINAYISSLSTNIGTWMGVQLSIIGLPFLFWYLRHNIKDRLSQYYLVISITYLLIMSFVFPYAGKRGGYLHAIGALQIITWVFVARGFDYFIRWGIARRGWQLIRSRIMFGVALILVVMGLTGGIFYRDVINPDGNTYLWNKEYVQYENIQEAIYQSSTLEPGVVMINNPVGYYYLTDQRTIVIPNAVEKDFLKLIDDFDVKYIVVDENIPERLKKYEENFFIVHFKLLKSMENGTFIYEVP